MPDSPDSATRQNDHVPIVGRSRSFERLVDPKRKVVFHGLARVDNPSFLSERLANEVSRKAFKLLVTVRQLDKEREVKHIECQVNLIREGTLDDFTVRPVTAKHNVATSLNEKIGVVEEFRMAVLRVPKTGIQKNVELDFPDGGCAYDVHSQCDIVWGDPLSNSDLKNPAVSFQLVRSDFQPCIGQQVAIAVYTENKVTAEAAEVPDWYTEKMLEEIYGQKNHVNILTGKITRVDGDRISYDINSFGGCSGVLIFLLDKDQPDSVTTQDYGRAIAVHSGPDPDHEKDNMGFLLSLSDR